MTTRLQAADEALDDAALAADAAIKKMTDCAREYVEAKFEEAGVDDPILLDALAKSAMLATLVASYGPGAEELLEANGKYISTLKGRTS